MKKNHHSLSKSQLKNTGIKILVSLSRFLFFFGMSYILLNPILIMLSRSLRSAEDVLNPTIIWIPQNFTLANFKVAFDLMDFKNTAWLTGRISVISTLLTMAIASVTGYSLARYKTFISKPLIVFVTLTIIIPPQTYLMPLFFHFNNFNLFGIGSIIGLFTGKTLSVNLTSNEISYYILAALGMGIRSGLFILIFYQFFRQMPKELENAARIDGCGEFRTFTKVMLPNASAPFLVAFLLSVIWYWNDTFYSTVLMRNKMMLANMVSNMQELIRTSYGGIGRGEGAAETVIVFAGALIYILLPLIIYLCLQKFFIQSVERTGIVG